MELINFNRIGGLDKSKGALGWTSGLDKFKVALDVKSRWRCGQVDYTKKVLCIGKLIILNGLVTWIGPRWHWI
jgi:hypothetical protein